jgi:chromosome segregation protein
VRQPRGLRPDPGTATPEDANLSLRKLEINGFKSFSSRLGVDFSRGVTSIIGPNGCGKTNIVDAIRWVMGEQKTRLLRNTKMENVIFNGTKQRKPLGMAEVHITLSNEDRAIPLDYSEVTISRKLHRSGLSEYYLNGELTRLKTIKGFLVDTGLGNHTYAIIEREMIDSVLSEKEQDKRYLFEEAAGIMRYRLQREEALRKIKHTETDLVRLGDIINELEKEIRSLRYQMGKARRFARLKEKVDRMEGTILKQSLYEFLGKKKELTEELKYHKGITLTDENEISILENKLQKLRIESSELEKKLQELHESRYTLSQSIKENEEKIAVNSERISTGTTRIEEDEEEIQKAKERLGTSQKDLLLYRSTLASKEDLLQECRTEIADRDRELCGILERFDAAKNELRDRKQLALDLMEEQAKAKGLREHVEKSMNELHEKRGNVENQLTLLEAERTGISSRLSAAGQKADDKKRDIATLEGTILRLTGKVDRTAELSVMCNDALSDVDRELSGLNEKKTFLKKIKQEHSHSGDEGHDNGRIRGVLADFIKVEKEHRTCFEACLAPVIQGLLTDSKDDALACIREVKGNGNGKMQILYPDGNGSQNTALEGAGVLGSAMSLVQCEAHVSDYITPYLSDVLVVENIDTAIALIEDNKAMRVATLDGVFFDGPGKIIVASGDEVAPTILEYDSKIGELDVAISWLEQRSSIIEKRRIRLVELRQKFAEDNARVRSLLEEEHHCEEKLASDQKGIEIELATVNEKIIGLKNSQSDIDSSIADLQAKLDFQTVNQEEQSGDEGIERMSLSDLEGRVIRLEKEREALQEVLSNKKLQEATVLGELSTIQSKIRTAGELESELQELIIAKEDDIKRCRLQIAVAEDEIATLKEAISQYHSEKDEVEKKIETVNRSYEEFDKTGSEIDKQLKEIKSRRDLKKENVDRCTVELARLETRISSIVEKGHESFDVDLERFIEGAEEFDPSEWEDLNRDELAILKEKLDRTGPVNMLAMEEYETKKERFDFLSKQKKDLEEGRESLLLAIRRINKEARVLLSETFEKVRENFKETFQTLFGGGEADLLFVDSEDPLEANIKIVANPKGKRLHDISSLSGGERALTALSLLFAIYLVKPSPFCILDEVDAPLDDANVTRFINMLRSFTDKTQFIVITHNKKTMEAADYLYGVTMEEPGVSTLISVKFTDVDRFGTKKPARGTGTAGSSQEAGEKVTASV